MRWPGAKIANKFISFVDRRAGVAFTSGEPTIARKDLSDGIDGPVAGLGPKRDFMCRAMTRALPPAFLPALRLQRHDRRSAREHLRPASLRINLASGVLTPININLTWDQDFVLVTSGTSGGSATVDTATVPLVTPLFSVATGVGYWLPMMRSVRCTKSFSRVVLSN